MLGLTAAIIAYCLPVLGAGFISVNARGWDATPPCAASNNPSWQSLLSCHPPMYKLIACKFKTFGACPWPTCPEGRTGEPGYEKFEVCPEGWRPAATLARDALQTELNLCVQARQNCEA
jgi:hypothetical protein